MTPEQTDAYENLLVIQEELDELSSLARSYVSANFPSQMAAAEAYRVFDFGTSVNPHDSTFAKIVESIEKGEVK